MPRAAHIGETEMSLIDNDDVIQALATNGSDQTFDVRALPRTHGTGEVLAPFAVDQAALLCSVGPEDPGQVGRGEFRGLDVD